jgi:hypothetical protein
MRLHAITEEAFRIALAGWGAGRFVDYPAVWAVLGVSSADFRQSERVYLGDIRPRKSATDRSKRSAGGLCNLGAGSHEGIWFRS